VHGIGYVEPVGDLRRLAFKHPGILSSCEVTVGQKVRQGDVLMRLEGREERARVVEAEAAVALAKAELAQTLVGVNPKRIEAQGAFLDASRADAKSARREFQRKQNSLNMKGATSEADRDLAEMDMLRKEALVRQSEADLANLQHYVLPEDRAVMEAKVQHAEAQLSLARATLAETEMRAPSDGTVLEILQREGSAAHTAFPEPVLIFAELSHLQVRAEIDEYYVLHLKPQQSAIIRTRDDSKSEFKTQVRMVKRLMGNKTVFAKTSTERKDLDVLQVLIDLPAGTELPVGLAVDVSIRARPE
jgi:multidrug resistance efflux pump